MFISWPGLIVGGGFLVYLVYTNIRGYQRRIAELQSKVEEASKL